MTDEQKRIFTESLDFMIKVDSGITGGGAEERVVAWKALRRLVEKFAEIQKRYSTLIEIYPELDDTGGLFLRFEQIARETARFDPFKEVKEKE